MTVKNLFEFEGGPLTRAESSKLAYIGSPVGTDKTNRDSDSWYTPPQYILSAREVLGSIDLDPFSSDAANKIVGATVYYTAERSAFDIDWRARTLWMNPPYGPLCTRAVEKFTREYALGHFGEAIVLVNNATDTQWFKKLSAPASAWCFTDHRISFLSPDGKLSSVNTRGQVFIYFGVNIDKFHRVFSHHGLVLQRVT